MYDKRIITIHRNGMSDDKPTYGHLKVLDNYKKQFESKTLELPWKDNRMEISCIPCGLYFVKRRFSEKYKHHLEVLNTKPRTMVLIHVANHAHQLKGCIAPGKDFIDIDKDGIIDVTSSRATLDVILSYINDTDVYPLIITSE